MMLHAGIDPDRALRIPEKATTLSGAW